jgi:CRISPR-associated endonuclease Csn1
LHQLYGDFCEFDIEHIIPYSRSFDDGFMNKTLCARRENQRKHNQTPYEAYQGTPRTRNADPGSALEKALLQAEVCFR